MTLANIVSLITDTVFPSVMTFFAKVFTTITGNAILYLPVLLALFATILFWVIRVVRKFGLRSATAGGRRRRR